jgi:hypothetical protein
LPAASKGLGLSPKETATLRVPATSDAKRRRPASPKRGSDPPSVAMIERHYGTLLDGSGAEIASRLDALDAEHEQVAVED